jgi:triosephosphate isomerase
MRKKIIAANWKMNMTVEEAGSFVKSFLLEVGNENRIDIVLVPAFTAVAKVSELLGNVQNVKLGAQNVYPESSGAFTGEVSPPMLRELFVRFVVLGHSERRTIFKETDAFINRKVKAVHEAQLRPILCIGETLEEREAGHVHDVLRAQLTGSLANISEDQLRETVIAYEPVWAIGTGKTATPEQAQEAHAFVREVLESLSSGETASRMRIQYGGSVKPSNAEELMGQPDIDGALVGGASLDPRSFAEIIKNTAAVL